MKIKSTLLVVFITLSLNILNISIAQAQYCSPTFSSGCFSWRNQAITLDAINWTIGTTSCSVSDYTTDTAYLDAGSTYPMTVTNGDWCGCAVWIDFNQDFVFDSTENLYYIYTANATNNYNFNITIPASVPAGIYRMRVVAGWGTDCFTVSANGYGPCGSYQYGNFDDFSLSINALPTGIQSALQSNPVLVEAVPNPVSSFVTITIHDFTNPNARLLLTDATGRLIQTIAVTKEKEQLDFGVLARGVYFLNYSDGTRSQSLKIVNISR